MRATLHPDLKVRSSLMQVMGDNDTALFDPYTLLHFAVLHMPGVLHHLYHFKRYGRGPRLVHGMRVALLVAVVFEVHESQGDIFNKSEAVLHVVGDIFTSVTGPVLTIALDDLVAKR